MLHPACLIRVQFKLLEFLKHRFEQKHRISVERVVSGPGIANVYVDGGGDRWAGLDCVLTNAHFCGDLVVICLLPMLVKPTTHRPPTATGTTSWRNTTRTGWTRPSTQVSSGHTAHTHRSIHVSSHSSPALTHTHATTHYSLPRGGGAGGQGRGGERQGRHAVRHGPRHLRGRLRGGGRRRWYVACVTDGRTDGWETGGGWGLVCLCVVVRGGGWC